MKFFSLWCFVLIFCFDAHAQTKPWAGRANVFLGDSYTTGDGIAEMDREKRFSTVLSEMMGSIEDNRGIGGSVLQDASTGCNNAIADFAAIPQKQSHHLFLYIAFGLNDVGFYNGIFTPEAFALRLAEMVDVALSRGWPAKNIVLLTPFWVPYYSFNIYRGCPEVDDDVITPAVIERQDAYAQAVIDVATNKGAVLADIYNAVKSLEPHISNSLIRVDDGLHYNEAGNAAIATFLSALDYSPEALPLTLSRFYLQRNSANIDLKWITENEIDTREFIVERSADGFNFSPIGKVAASGNTTAAKEYSFKDAQPLRGVNIYRLKMADLDGSFTYSKSISATHGSNVIFSIYPNPAKGKFSVYMEDFEGAQLQVVDTRGSIVHQQRVVNHITEFNTGRWSAGLYFIRVNGKGGMHIQKVLVE